MRPPLRGNGIGAWRARMAFYEMRKQAVLSQWLQQYVWVILPVLAIPLAILLGARRTNGAIIISGAVAILAIAFQGYRTATIPFDINTGGYNTLDAIVSQLGGVLSLAAWTLVLAHAAQARRWGWFALIVVANFLSYAIQFISNLLPYLICSSNPPLNGDISACMTSHQALLTLITLGEAIGPIATLIYILHALERRERQLPDGLVVSSLRERTRPGEDFISAE